MLWGGLQAHASAATESLPRLAGRWELDSSLTYMLSNQAFPPLEMKLESDPKSKPREVSADLQAVAGSGNFLDTGELTLSSRVRKYGVFVRDGQRFLVFAPPGAETPQVSRLWLVEARKPDDDLLILAEPASGQILAMRRATEGSSSPISQLSQALLEVALEGENFEDADQARKLLAERPDWSAVIDRLMAGIRSDPGARHNNRCLTLHPVVEAHAAEAQVDLGPLLATLESPSWTNQQKCGYVLGALTDRDDLFAGHRDEALATLIRRVPSQRGRVVNSALAALRDLTGQTFAREPEVWRAWYEGQTGKPLDLKGAVHELLVVARVRDDGLEVGGKPVASVNEAVDRVRELRDSSPLPVSVVLQVESSAMASATSESSIPPPAIPFLKALEPLGLPTTVAPLTDTFYPPYPPAFPDQP